MLIHRGSMRALILRGGSNVPHSLIMCTFPGVPMRVGNKQLRLSDAEHRARGARVAAAKAKARVSELPADRAEAKRVEKFEGCHGENPFARLPYANLQSLFAVPVAHALLYGVCKHFLEDISRNPTSDADTDITLSAAQKKLVKSRAADIIATADFGRGYKCVVEYR